MGEFIMKAWLSLKIKKAMKGGGACGIHRAMKYRSVDMRWRGRQDVYTHARIHTVNSPLTDKQSV